ncbi:MULTISPECIES: ThiF family adenylyltransferase [unclassified Sulfitobacter]|uniref:ThiF family adenylyltransferase n=1 Tax=unclassified Sulfitobacter TaxID=196795 RepID=UPI0009DEAF42|nr:MULTISPECIES: ThiF family adenylyltransferase [unclassified Sulfitobacter]PTA97681.1 hypothetical protein C8254_16195 [Sulfitobacter sp. CB-A]
MTVLRSSLMETNATLDIPVMNDAIEKVRQLAEGAWGGMRLSGDDLRSLPKGPWAAGWRFRLSVLNELKDLDLVLDETFPWSAPRLYLKRPPALGTFPHLEGDGFVCVFQSRTPVDPSEPVGIVRAYLNQVLSLAHQWSDSAWVNEEIAGEYLSYLEHGMASKPIRSLVSPLDYQSSVAYACRRKSCTLMAATESDLSAWLHNLSGQPQRPVKLEEAVILRFADLPSPQSIPRNAKQLIDLAEALGERELLEERLMEKPKPVLVGVVLPTEPHPTMIGYDIPAPRLETQRGQKHVTAGFRPQKMSAEVLIARRAGAGIKTSPLEVERIDASWIHGRDQIPDVDFLRGKKVTIVGCGSLGSGVAVLLAKAGVGNLNLVDSETLRSENVSRHELGVSNIGKRKASALAERIRTGFPHIRHVGASGKRWQTVVQDQPDLILEADLLVVAIGSWSDEGELETWRVEQDQPLPTIFGWLEPHGVAAHAVSLADNGPCLGCGLTEFGQSRLKVTAWLDGSTVRTHPACGGAFQPYGAAQLAHGQSLVADLSLDFLMGRSGHSHRIWSAPERVVQAVGGSWTNEWKVFTEQTFKHGGEFEQQWIRRPECRICGGKS